MSRRKVLPFLLVKKNGVYVPSSPHTHAHTYRHTQSSTPLLTAVWAPIHIRQVGEERKKVWKKIFPLLNTKKGCRSLCPRNSHTLSISMVQWHFKMWYPLPLHSLHLGCGTQCLSILLGWDSHPLQQSAGIPQSCSPGHILCIHPYASVPSLLLNRPLHFPQIEFPCLFQSMQP